MSIAHAPLRATSPAGSFFTTLATRREQRRSLHVLMVLRSALIGTSAMVVLLTFCTHALAQQSVTYSYPGPGWPNQPPTPTISATGSVTQTVTGCPTPQYNQTVTTPATSTEYIVPPLRIQYGRDGQTTPSGFGFYPANWLTVVNGISQASGQTFGPTTASYTIPIGTGSETVTTTYSGSVSGVQLSESYSQTTDYTDPAQQQTQTYSLQSAYDIVSGVQQFSEQWRISGTATYPRLVEPGCQETDGGGFDGSGSFNWMSGAMSGGLNVNPLPPGQAGAAYPPAPVSAQLISGGTTPYNVTGISGLPAGLRIDRTGGNVIGTVTSQVSGTYTLTGTVTDSSAPPLSAPVNVTLTVYCGNPSSTWTDQDAVTLGLSPTTGNGDSRDALIQEHINKNINFYNGQAPQGEPQSNYSAPHCTDFTQANGFPSPYDSLSLFGSKAGGSEPDYSTLFSWTIVRSPLVVATSLGPEYGIGLYAWIDFIRSLGDSQFRIITSSYRNPYRNSLTTAASGQAAATHSQHILGNAIDLQNIAGSVANPPANCTGTNAATAACTERTLLVVAAIQAGSQFVEPPTLYCKLKCVHAVWTAGPYPGGNTPNSGTGYPGLYVNP